MQKTIGSLGGVILILLAVLVVHHWRGVRTLEAQLAQARTELDRLTKERQTLADRVGLLTEGREGDRALLGQLWNLVHNARSKPAAKTAETGAKSYDIAALKSMAAASKGNLDQVMHQVLPPERLSASLERHAAKPAFWVAAASMCGSPVQARQYLETAAARFPESVIAQAALIEAKKGDPQADAATRAAIDNLRKADPTSSLADHYDAYFGFKEGDSQAGLQALAAASEKNNFADHRMELMMSRYECLLENGCSDGAALALSAFSLGFEHLPMLREVGQQALDQAQSAFAAGQMEPALQTTEYVARIGRNLSASGRFIVYDRLGMELQESALRAQRRFHESTANSYQVGEVDFQLGALQARAAQISSMADGFGSVLARMTDGDIVRYIESTITHGEFPTLQRLNPKP